MVLVLNVVVNTVVVVLFVLRDVLNVVVNVVVVALFVVLVVLVLNTVVVDF